MLLGEMTCVRTNGTNNDSVTDKTKSNRINDPI